MIEKIKITNFKSIEKLELDLGRINVLIGENGCGKTNILEAIGFGAYSIFKQPENTGLAAHGIRIVNVSGFFYRLKVEYGSEKSFFRVEFSIPGFGQLSNSLLYSERLKWRALVSLNGDTLYLTEFKGLFDDPSLGETFDELRNGFLEKFKISESINEKTRISDFINFRPEDTYLKNFGNDGQLEPLGFHGEGLFKELKKIVKEQPEKFEEIKNGLRAIDWFDDLELPDDLFAFEKTIILKDRYLGSNPDVQFLEQGATNEGFLFLLFYFTLFVSDDTPKFFAIDNIDQALNPRLCIKLMQTLTEMAKKYDKQVIFTTHNPSILDGLDLKDDDQRLHVVYRNADGNTVAKRHIRKEGLPGVESARLSEAFIRGYLGGLPKHF